MTSCLLVSRVGSIAVAVALALSTSAPLAARAEATTSTALAAEAFPGAGDAPMCRVDDPSGRAARVDTSAKIAQIRAMIAAEAAASGESAGEGGFVALGNRGYNYDAGALVDPALLEFEARRQGR